MSDKTPEELADDLKKLSEQVEFLETMVRRSGTGFEELVSSSRNLTDAQKEEIRLNQFRRAEDRKRADAAAEIERIKTQAQREGIRSIESFTNALFSGTKGFEKFGKTLDAAGDAFLAFSKTMGAGGQIVGLLVKGATMIGSAQLKQADNVLKASDELSKMGGAGGQTAKELLEMGHRAGLTSKNLDAFIKPLKSMGAGIVALGDNVGAGTQVFAKMAEVSSDTRKKFQRLGVSQEELLQSQADYVRLQQISGRNLGDQAKDAKKLQASSLAYTENLLLLASLSGKDIETIKKEQELALSREETLIQTLRTENEIKRLKESGKPEDLARAEALKKELDARDKLLHGIQTQVGDEKLSAAMAKFLASGAITEESAFLKRMGLPLEDFQARMKKGEDVTGDFLNALKKATLQSADDVGQASIFNKETGHAYGLMQKIMQYAAGRRDVDENEARKKSADQLAAAQKEGNDKLQDSRAQLLEAERFLAIGMDELLLKTNFLFNGFDSATTAVLALQAAALLAAGVLGAKGIAGMLSKGKDLASLARGASAATTVAGKGAAGAATSAAGAGLAVKAGAALGAGVGGYLLGSKVINPYLDKKAEEITGTKGATFGTALYDIFGGKKDKEKLEKADLESKIALGVKRMAEGQTISKDMAETLKKAGKDISTAKITGEKEQEKTKAPANIPLESPLGSEGKTISKEKADADAKAKAEADKLDNIKKSYAERVKKLEAEQKARLEEKNKQSKVTAPKTPEDKAIKDSQLKAEELLKKQETKELSPELVMFNKMLEQVTKNLGNVNLNFTKFDTTLKDINTEFGLDLAGFDDKKSTELRDELKRTRDDIVRKFREVSGTAAPAAPSGGSAPTSGGTAAGPSAAPSTAAPTSGTYSPGTTPVPKPESGAPAGAGPGATETGKKYPSDGLEQVKKAGLKVRPYGDVYQGGPLTDKAVDVALALQNLPGFQFFTGLNDAYHIKKHPSSQHAKGRGIDFTVDPKYQSIEETTKLKKMISSISGVSKVLNEYYPPSQGGDANQFTTGGHFHVNVAKEGGIFDGPETGYPVMQHGTELTAPLDKDSILMKMAKTAGEVEDIAKLVTEPPGSETNDSDSSRLIEEFTMSNNEIFAMISDKLDRVIDVLTDGNDTSNKILQHTRI